MELDQFISGERFQALADISIIPLGDGVGESEFYFVKEQQKNNNYTSFYYTNDTTELPDYVQAAKTIFVNTWTLDKFFRIIFPLLKNKYTFISHNSDLPINETHKQFLDDEKVLKWFSQNIEISHPKLFALPIGIGNQQYSHGDLALLQSLMSKNILKDNLVYKNFNIDTNRGVRYVVDAITTQRGVPMHRHASQEIYFEHIARSKFVISPPGNGPDCHRVWECLYLRTIPVIQRHPSFDQFKHLPIHFIDSWESFTIEGLQNCKHLIDDSSTLPEELYMSHWRRKIIL
jgi:hypothetical protein